MNYSTEIRAYAERNFQFDGFDIYLFGWERNKVDADYVAEPVTFHAAPDIHQESERPVPAFSLREAPAQRLMDDLWNAGIRPTHSQHVSEIIQAKDEHIKEQRGIIDRLFGLIGHAAGERGAR